MRPLSRHQLRNRLLVFGGLSLAFMAIVIAAEQVVPTATGPSWWTGIAALLGIVAAGSLLRWSDAADLPQSEWQPALLQRVLAGGLSFQAGLLGYFVAGDLSAALAGCGLFLAALVITARLLAGLTYGDSDA
jgi:hypothetical protein